MTTEKKPVKKKPVNHTSSGRAAGHGPAGQVGRPGPKKKAPASAKKKSKKKRKNTQKYIKDT